ncbi:hypothetical protein HJD18_01325 [Thermoleophilia bacterium SCSIO 60948]|nr:hypothetical protein HJD18_01325 [Thermoleophilia bacterium SCSIO 60948]
MNGRAGILASLLAVVALLAAYLLLGGGTYAPREVPDPCAPRELSPERPVGEQIALSALDGAACELQVTREDLTLALASESERESFQAAYDVDDEEFAEATRAGLERAIGDAEGLGTLSATEASIAREVVARLPYEQLVDLLGRVTGEDDPLAALTETIVSGVELGEDIDGILEDIGNLIP